MEEETSRLLLNIERFLESCEDIAQQQFDTGIGPVVDWKTSETFHRYIEILEDRLEELMVYVGVSHDEWGHRLLDYKRRIETLSALLEPITDEDRIHYSSRTIDSLKILKEYISVNGTLCDQGVVPCGRKVGMVMERGPHGVARGEIPVKPKASFKPITVSDAAKSRLEKESRIQEGLTDELVDMATALKQSTRGVQSMVQERDALLDATGESLETSLQGTRTSVSRVERARVKNRMNFCFTMMVILLLVLGCAAMVVFIRITSFVGYTGQKLEKEL